MPDATTEASSKNINYERYFAAHATVWLSPEDEDTV